MDLRLIMNEIKIDEKAHANSDSEDKSLLERENNELSLDEQSQDMSVVTCPITSLLRLAAAKWTVEILRELAIKPMRTRRLLLAVPGMSMKSLQDRLKALEGAQMITITRSQTAALKTEHEITERGRKLLTVLISLKDLAEESQPRTCECPMETGVASDCPIGNRC
jgi:DNA-binding HxlR family transcriptional regulator